VHGVVLIEPAKRSERAIHVVDTIIGCSRARAAHHSGFDRLEGIRINGNQRPQTGGVLTIPLIFRRRALAMTPYLKCAELARAADRTSAAGAAAATSSFVRPDRRSSIVRPEPDSANKKSRQRPTAAQAALAGRSDRGSLC
jgi:hypothetical protein